MSLIELDDLPFILAPCSRPSSPSNLVNQNDNLLLHRIMLADLPRKLTGTLSNPNESKLPRLLSTTIKGQWKFSPWGLKANERNKEIEVEGPWNYDLPNDMDEWRLWEEQKKVLREEIKIGRGIEKGKGRAVSGQEVFSSNYVEGSLRPKDYPTPKSNIAEESLDSEKAKESNIRRTQSSILEQPSRLSTGGDELATHQSLPTVLPSSAQYVPSSLMRTVHPPQQQQQTTLTSTLPRSKPFATGSGQKKSFNAYSESLPRIHSRSININSPTHSPPKKSPPKKPKKSKSSTTSTIPKLYQDVSSSIPEPDPVSEAAEGQNSSHSHQSNHSSKRAPSQSLPNLASTKLQLRDPLISGSPSKSTSMEGISVWGAVRSKDSLGSMMDRGGIDEEILGEQGDSEFMLTDSPTKPLPNYPLSYSDSSIPFLATGLPLDLPILKESNPTATPPLPLETSTPTLLPILVEGSAGSKGSIGRLLAPHGSGNVMKLTGRSSSRGESTEGAIELEEQVSRFLAVEVDMI